MNDGRDRANWPLTSLRLYGAGTTARNAPEVDKFRLTVVKIDLMLYQNVTEIVPSFPFNTFSLGNNIGHSVVARLTRTLELFKLTLFANLGIHLSLRLSHLCPIVVIEGDRLI